MFAWLRRFFREHELPVDPSAPVRVDFVGRVVSPNTTASPITGLTAAMLEIVLMDWEHVVTNSQSSFGGQEYDRFIALGGVRYGTTLIIEDGASRQLVIENFLPWSVFPLSERPLVLDTPVPRDLAAASQKSQHMLSYREVRFREDDRVRVVATVRTELRAMGTGYRGAMTRTLVPVESERLELYEML